MTRAMLQLVVAGLTVGSGYALVALGIHIILRATRVVNFAQGEFVVLGGLIAYAVVTGLHLNVWVALVVSTAVGFFSRSRLRTFRLAGRPRGRAN